MRFHLLYEARLNLNQTFRYDELEQQAMEQYRNSEESLVLKYQAIIQIILISRLRYNTCKKTNKKNVISSNLRQTGISFLITSKIKNLISYKTELSH